MNVYFILGFDSACVAERAGRVKLLLLFLEMLVCLFPRTILTQHLLDFFFLLKNLNFATKSTYLILLLFESIFQE